MFEDAYAHVQQRYIERVGMDELALAAMARLNAVDRQLSVGRQPNAIVLYRNNRVIDRFPSPAPWDGKAWASVTASVLGRSLSASPNAAGAMPEDLYSALMAGVVGKLDQHSRYESARQASNQRAARDGFGGVGATIHTRDNKTTVVEVLPDSPADAGGLRAGDQITHVGGTPLKGLDPQAVIDRLRGPVATTVDLNVLRGIPSAALQLKITRAYIVPPTVIASLKHGVGVVRIRSFNRQTAADLEQAVQALQQQAQGELPGVILDLRNNPGGLLDQAVDVADLFLNRGPMIFTRGRHPAANSAFAADSHEVLAGVPMAVLINGRSASASEMLAATLQDRGRAVVVGSTTHGKGSVQNLERLPNGGELIITWSRMYAPSGYVLDGLGVLPNVCTSEAYRKDALARLEGAKGRLRKQFQDWYRYDRFDAQLAGILRNTCPASFDAPEIDRTVAVKILNDPRTYRLALEASRLAVGARSAGSRPSISSLPRADPGPFGSGEFARYLKVRTSDQQHS